jgi:hypothetical protein
MEPRFGLDAERLARNRRTLYLIERANYLGRQILESMSRYGQTKVGNIPHSSVANPYGPDAPPHLRIQNEKIAIRVQIKPSNADITTPTADTLQDKAEKSARRPDFTLGQTLCFFFRL